MWNSNSCCAFHDQLRLRWTFLTWLTWRHANYVWIAPQSPTHPFCLSWDTVSSMQNNMSPMIINHWPFYVGLLTTFQTPAMSSFRYAPLKRCRSPSPDFINNDKMNKAKPKTLRPEKKKLKLMTMAEQHPASKHRRQPARLLQRQKQTVAAVGESQSNDQLGEYDCHCEPLNLNSPWHRKSSDVCFPTLCHPHTWDWSTYPWTRGIPVIFWPCQFASGPIEKKSISEPQPQPQSETRCPPSTWKKETQVHGKQKWAKAFYEQATSP